MERSETKRGKDLTVEVLHTNTGVQIKMVLSEEAMKYLEDLANRRGKDIGGIFAEGLRLEGMLVEGKLLHARRHWWGRDYPRQLIGA